MSFSKPSDNRNVVTVLAPADTPWPVIDNIRIMVTAKKLFAVDVQIAPPAQHTNPFDYRRYSSSSSESDPTAKPGTKNAPVGPRYGYSAAGKAAAQQQRTDRTSVKVVGENDQPASRVEPTSSGLQSVLRKTPGIVVKMGDTDRLVSVVPSRNMLSVVAAVLESVKERKDILLWSGREGLIVQTPQDSAVAQQVTQKILDSLSTRRDKNPAAFAGAYTSGSVRNDANSQPVVETRIFMLKYADASVIAQGVAQLFDKGFGIAPDVRTKSVVVRGAASQLREMEVIVEMLDREQPKRLTEPPAAAGTSSASIQQISEGKNTQPSTSTCPPWPLRRLVFEFRSWTARPAKLLRACDGFWMV